MEGKRKIKTKFKSPCIGIDIARKSLHLDANLMAWGTVDRQMRQSDAAL